MYGKDPFASKPAITIQRIPYVTFTEKISYTLGAVYYGV